MRGVCFSPILLTLVLWANASRAAAPSDLNPPPINQPASFKTFGRPIGTLFEGSMDADPRELRLDSTLTLTIRITYKGSRGEAPQRAPRPPVLGDEFTAAFTVGTVTEESDRNGWRFTVQLTPLSDKVDRIPAILFTYYSPLGYRTVELPGIDIRVTPREQVRPAEVRDEPVPATAPVSRFVTGSNVLSRDERWTLPSIWIIVLILLLPPLACLAWYRLWQQLYPDEAMRLKRRRSRAARAALRGLDLARATRPDLRGAMAAAIITKYLKERLDLPVLEPTPRETAEHLEKVGCSEMSVTRASAFFELCDRARFAADPSTGRERIINLAEELIQTMEMESAA